MARTALSVVTPKGPHSVVTAGQLDFLFAAADPVNGNSFPCTGRDLLLMHNGHVTDPATVTITSAPDPYGRTKDIATYSLSAGDYAAFWIGSTVGWKQSDGKVYLDAAGTGTVKFAVLRIPD